MPTTNLGIEYVSSNLTQPEVPINTAFDVIDSAIGFAAASLTTYTPTISAGSGTFASAFVSGAYRRIGSKMIFIQIKVSITTNGTAAGDVIATLPFATPNDGFAQVLSGIEGAIGGKSLQAYILPNTSSIHIRNYDATYPGGTGTILYVEGIYEAV